jgi:hypothetical protein
MSSLLVFNRVYRLKIQSVMLVFRPSFVNYCPSTFSPVHLTPSPPRVNKYRPISLYNVGGGIGLCGEEHIQELYTLNLTRFRTNKIA